jgi:hypothetical protein
VPGVDLGLQRIAPGQQGAVARGELGRDLAKAVPEGRAGDSSAWQSLYLNEIK